MAALMRVSLPSELRKMLHSVPCDVLLECDDGTMEGHSQILFLASGVLNFIFGSDLSSNAGGQRQIKLDGSIREWSDIVSMLYPTGPRLSAALPNDIRGYLGALLRILPLVHKYDFTSLQAACLDELKFGLPFKLSLDCREPECFVLTWLDIGDSLHLDAIKDICFAYLREHSRNVCPYARRQLMEAIYSPCSVAVADTKARDSSRGQADSSAAARSRLSDGMLRLSPETRDEVLVEVLQVALTNPSLKRRRSCQRRCSGGSGDCRALRGHRGWHAGGVPFSGGGYSDYEGSMDMGDAYSGSDSG